MRSTRRRTRRLATTATRPRLAPTLAALAACFVASPAAVSGQAGGPPEAEYLTNELYAEAGYPFSEAVRVGDMLYLSGMVGLDSETGELVPGGIGPETRHTLERIRTTLERHGSSMDRVVKCIVMLADIAEWPAMNEVYRTFFEEGRYPARSALGASGLALDARVEIECLALAGDGS